MAGESILRSIREYLRAVNASGIHARRAILFGSHARGDAKPESDIDIVVIAPEFDGRPDRGLFDRLWELRASTDARIEPIPCGEQEWERNDSRMILEIARREGEPVVWDSPSSDLPKMSL